MKNPKFVNCTFIIHKNGNKTYMQPILESKYTSFIFNKNFCEVKGKKVIHWVKKLSRLEECGSRPNFFLEV